MMRSTPACMQVSGILSKEVHMLTQRAQEAQRGADAADSARREAECKAREAQATAIKLQVCLHLQ